MKTKFVRRPFFFALLGLAGILLSGCAVLKLYFRSSVDRPDGTLSLPGLKEEAVIRRDDLGIPYIEAKNEGDLMLAAGYAMASDRLWQMTLFKLAAQGRLAELFGKKMLPIDIYLRTIGTNLFTERAYAALSPELKNPLQRFAEGVNEYVSLHRGKLPPEFSLAGVEPPPWQPEDCLSVFGIANLGLSVNLTEELSFLALAERVGLEKAAWLFPVHPDEEIPFTEARKLSGLELSDSAPLLTGLAAVSDALTGVLGRGAPASNNWALAGSRTRSGRPLVANDTHLDLTIPSMWMIMHLKSPDYDAAGVMIPGVPLVNLGFNGRVAWGATMVMADSQDIFLEKLRTENGKTCAEYRGGCEPLAEKVETFRVKGRAPETRVIRSTRHGPLLNEALAGIASGPKSPLAPTPVDTRLGLALRWSQADGETGPRGLSRLGIAQNLEEARQAMSDIDIAYLNLVYADKEGIAWQATGQYPKRPKGLGLFPSPGWTGEYDWDGYLTFPEQPHSENPPEGFLVTANNRTLPREEASRYGSTWIGPERADRVRALLSGLKNATAGDMMAIQADQFSLMAEKTQKVLFSGNLTETVMKAIDALPEAARRKEALAARELLSPGRFDAVMRADSAPASLLGAFHHFLTRNIFLDELGPEESEPWQAFIKANSLSYSAPEDHLLGREDSPFWDDITTPRKETKADILARSLADAYHFLAQHLGKKPARWEWGKLHNYHWRSEVSAEAGFLSPLFDRGPFPAGGDYHTVNVTGYDWGKNFRVWIIPAMRFVVDFGLEEPAFLVVSSGQSGNPVSEHYADMIPLWLQVKNHPLPFRRENVLRQYNHILTLKPSNK
jgi:acyl-homoserine-lactone acylase